MERNPKTLAESLKTEMVAGNAGRPRTWKGVQLVDDGGPTKRKSPKATYSRGGAAREGPT